MHCYCFANVAALRANVSKGSGVRLSACLAVCLFSLYLTFGEYRMRLGRANRASPFALRSTFTIFARAADMASEMLLRFNGGAQGGCRKNMTMERIEDYFRNIGCAITVCDADCNIVYQNGSSVSVNGNMVGKNMSGCHNERSRAIIHRILSEGISNTYTISKKGQKKIIHQAPWQKEDGAIAGIIEFSIVIPEEMPHYDRG